MPFQPNLDHQADPPTPTVDESSEQPRSKVEMPQGLRLPVELAPFVDRSNAIQMLLLQRVKKLTVQDVQMFANGATPAALSVLKRILPEIGFLFDYLQHRMEAGFAPPLSAGPVSASGVPADGLGS
jgi:hypothetical protein